MQKRNWIYCFICSSPPSPFSRKLKATSERLCVSDGLHKHRRSLQMAKINMRVLLKDLFTQTICSASEIMNKWRFSRNNWKDFCVSADAIIEWHRRDCYQLFSTSHVLAVPFHELNTSFCSYFTHVFVRNCRLLLQFKSVAWFPKRNLAASKGYLDLVGQEREGRKQRIAFCTCSSVPTTLLWTTGHVSCCVHGISIVKCVFSKDLRTNISTRIIFSIGFQIVFL